MCIPFMCIFEDSSLTASQNIVTVLAEVFTQKKTKLCVHYLFVLLGRPGLLAVN